MVEFVSVAIFMSIITVILFLVAIFTTNDLIRYASGLMTLLMIVSDFFMARLIVEQIVPSNTGFIRIMDTFYSISINFYIVVISFAGLFMIYKIYIYIKELPISRRNERANRQSNYLKR